MWDVAGEVLLQVLALPLPFGEVESLLRGLLLPPGCPQTATWNVNRKGVSGVVLQQSKGLRSEKECF